MGVSWHLEGLLLSDRTPECIKERKRWPEHRLQLLKQHNGALLLELGWHSDCGILRQCGEPA
eukprot:975142-Rhodomonas_salina.1